MCPPLGWTATEVKATRDRPGESDPWAPSGSLHSGEELKNAAYSESGPDALWGGSLVPVEEGQEGWVDVSLRSQAGSMGG